jgi:hypothetical protein
MCGPVAFIIVVEFMVQGVTEYVRPCSAAAFLHIAQFVKNYRKFALPIVHQKIMIIEHP